MGILRHALCKPQIVMSKPIVSIIIAFSTIFLCSNMALGKGTSCNILFPIFSEAEKAGYIDCDGKVVVPPTAENAYEFSESIGVIIYSDGAYTVSFNGKKRFLTKLEMQSGFSEGLAIVKLSDGGYGYVGRNGKVLFRTRAFPVADDEPDLPTVRPFNNGRASIKTSKGWIIIDRKFRKVSTKSFADVSDFQGGLATVQTDEEPSRYGVVNTRGEYVLHPQFNWPEISDEGLIVVEEKEGEWKIINRDGKVITRVQYFSVRGFSDGLAGVTKERKLGSPVGFINSSGKLVLPIKYSTSSKFSDGLLPVEVDGKIGFISRNGELTIKPQFKPGMNDFQDGLAYVRDWEYEGYIDRRGKWIWKRKR